MESSDLVGVVMFTGNKAPGNSPDVRHVLGIWIRATVMTPRTNLTQECLYVVKKLSK